MRRRKTVAFDKQDYGTLAVDIEQIKDFSPITDGCFIHLTTGETIFVLNRYGEDAKHEYNGKPYNISSVQSLIDRVLQ